MSDKLIEPGPNSPTEPNINPLLKFALELGPLVVFFFANSRGDWLAERFPALAELGGPLFIATALFMAATVIALAISWSLTRTLPIMPLVSGFFVLALGGLTLWFQSEYFIKIKPTIVNLLFSVILIGGVVIFNRPLVAYVFSQAFKLDDAGWRKLTLRWGVFFVVMAMMNEVVWRGADYYYLQYLPVSDLAASQKASDSLWAGFKVWATMPITMLFMMFQIPLLKHHATEPLIKDYAGDGK